jgi:effector-binding domain-containing protein
MKTKSILLIFSTFLTVIAMTQETQVKKAKDFKVEIKELDDIHMVYYEFTGPYQDCFNDFGKLMEYIQTNQLPMGAYSLGLFYDDPENVPAEKLRSEPGYMVQGPVKGNDDFKYKKIPATKAVSVRYKSMEEIMPAYEAISKYIAENSLKTEPYSMEIYYSYDPNTVDAEILFLMKD